ncbi:MAG TPA: sugar phosphate isomerase/epimerase [Bryobacteraceae bacterium]|nr:sugar phosphate isomerase/epimerase [Bryobacteraceae bacterium]
MYTRRDLGKIALASLPLARAFGAINSKIHGVQIGAITYSFGNMPLNEIIQAYVNIGLSEMELMSNHAETAMGAPSPAPAGRGPGRGQGARGRGPGAGGPRQLPIRPVMTEEQIAEARNRPAAVELRNWRMAVKPEQFAEVRKSINAAGIDVAILCFNMSEAITDDEIDYGFRMAKGFGAKAISTSTRMPVAKRVAPFAEKYKMMVGFHGHDNTADPNETGSLESYSQALSYGKYNGVNLDIGHFTSANYDAVAFIKAHHDRITNLHIKDRKKDHGGNVIWGEGDTPIREVLQLCRKEKYPFPANIELEYAIPEGSTREAEVKKCYEFCQKALA